MTDKDTLKKRKENIKEKLERIRKGSPSGTIGESTGRAGATDSYQATGGGTTVIVTNPVSGKSAVIPASSVKTEEIKPTSKGEFVESLLQKQEDIKGTGQKVTVSSSGDVIVKAPQSAKVDISRARELAQDVAIKSNKKEQTIFKGTTKIKKPFEQVVAVPSREAAEKGEAKKLRYQELTQKEKVKYYTDITYDPSILIASKKLSNKREKEKLFSGRYKQYKEIGEANLKNPIIGASVNVTLLAAKKAKEKAILADTKLKQVTEKYFFPDTEEKLYSFSDRYRKDSKDYFGLKGISNYYNKLIPSSVEYAGGFIGGVRREPTKTVLTTAAFFVLPPVVKGIGKFISPATGLFTKVLPRTSGLISKTISYGLPIAYGGTVAFRGFTAKRPFAKFGEISSTEIVPMVAGTYVGTKFWQKAEGFAMTLGRENIPTEKLVPKDVIEGKQLFPTAPPKRHLTLFRKNINRLPDEKQAIMFHAAPEEITDYTIGKGSSELPGLYGSSDVSAYFLKLQRIGESKLYGGSIFKPYGSPQVLAIKPSGFRYRGYKKTPEGYIFKGKDILGVADVPGMKTEIEAVLPVGTELIEYSNDFYFKWKGIRVPIDQFKVGEKATVKNAIKAEEILGSYEYATESYASTPSSFLSNISKQSYSPSNIKSEYDVEFKPDKSFVKHSEVKSSRKLLYSSGLPVSSNKIIYSSINSAQSSYPSSSQSSISKLYSSSSSASSLVSKLSSQVSKPSLKVSLSSSKVSSTSSRVSSKSSISKSSFYKSYLSSYSSGSSSLVSYPITEKPPPPFIWFGSDRKIEKAFDVQLKRFGSFKTIAKGLPVGRASRVGVSEAKRTLGATFRLVESGTTQLKDIGFKPSPKEFREYRIKKGKKISTPMTFIQKKEFRLSAQPEKIEIQKFRKMRGF